MDESSRDLGVSSYTASQQVDLLNGFSSNYGDNYIIYIDSTLTPCVQPDTLVAGNYYKADVITAGDYYPFGMKMPGREFFKDSAHYRYGFNGQEKSDEIMPNTTTAEFWEYDSRLGRRFNIDPVNAGQTSGYSTFGNNPIYFIDPSGDEARDNTKDKHPKHKHNKDNTTGTQETINPDGTFTGIPNVKYLKEIVVEGKRHTSLADHSALSVFNQTPQQRIANKKWSAQNITYRLKREDGLSPEDAVAAYLLIILIVMSVIIKHMKVGKVCSL